MRTFRNTTTGTRLLVPFLAATLVLSVWLGVHALQAVRSHRETAEAALRDYARTATWESSRIARDELDTFLDELFDEAAPRLRRGRDAQPEVVRWELDDALDDQRCDCPALHASAAFFSVDLRTGSVLADPDTIAASVRDRVRALFAGTERFDPRSRTGLLSAPAGDLLPDAPAVVAFIFGFDGERNPVTALGMIVPARAFGELFAHWYDTRPLLPPAIAGALPNDSILRIAVHGPAGVPVLTPSVPFAATFSARDTLEPMLGSFVIEAAVRPDAADRLIIGGLPGSNLPLLLGLLILTLGVGGAALFQIRRERQLARLRDDFISGVSHELRTPLAQIRVFADLEESGKLRSDEERARAIRVINREAARLSHLVENVLRFSRSRRGSPPLRRETVDVNESVTDAVEAMQPLAGLRRMHVSTHADAQLHAVVGRDALRQILVNLLDNAVKYGPPGQTIEIGISRVGEAAVITVDDEGPGIPSGERERIFEPYRRLERDIEARHPGTGIGLAVVADLISLYGGAVRVENGRRGGACFRIELPAADVLEPSRPPGRVTEVPA